MCGLLGTVSSYCCVELKLIEHLWTIRYGQLLLLLCLVECEKVYGLYGNITVDVVLGLSEINNGL